VGIKGASLVLKGRGAVASRPGPAYGVDRGRLEPGRKAGYGGPSFSPAGTEAGSWACHERAIHKGLGRSPRGASGELGTR
jgi:hypothetical protein